MLFEHFLNINSENEDLRVAAHQAIEAEAKNPGFIVTLFSLLDDSNVQADQNLLNHILVVILSVSRMSVANIINAAHDPLFVEAMIRHLFGLKPEFRGLIIECILLSCDFENNNYSPVFEHLLSSISEQSSFTDIYTAISISIKYIKKTVSAEFASTLSNFIIPLLTHSFANVNDTNAVLCIGAFAKLLRILISRQQIFLDSKIDQAIDVFAQVLSQNTNSQEADKTKQQVIDFYSLLVSSVYEKWKTMETLQPWCVHFEADLLPIIVQSSFKTIELPRSINLFGKLFRLFYNFLFFGITPEQFLTPQFFHIIISAAKLSEDALFEFEINPTQFICFYTEHEDIGFFSTRICASQFIDAIIKKYGEVFDPLPLLIEDPTDTIQFEAKIYLLQRYAMNVPLPEEVFTSYFDLLTTEQPLYIVSALIRLVSIQMATDNTIIGISVAQHFIINADNLEVQYSGAYMMDQCFTDFNENLEDLADIVDLDVSLLFNKLLTLSEELRLPVPTILLEKIYKIGTNHFLEIAPQLIDEFFKLWDDKQMNDDDNQALIVAPQLMNSVAGILETIPSDSQLLFDLAQVVLSRLIKDISSDEENPSLSEQIRVASVFSRHISQPLPVQFEFLNAIFQHIEDPSLIMSDLVLFICPLILNPQSQFFEKGHTSEIVSLIERTLTIQIIDQEYGQEARNTIDKETIAYCMVLASCLILSGGVQYFPFITTAAQVLMERPKPMILWGTIYVFAAALFIDPAQAQTLFVQEIIDVVVKGLSGVHSIAYRELKLATIVLSYFTKWGSVESFEVASSLLPQLFDMKEIDDKIGQGNDFLIKRSRIHREEELFSLTPLLSLPIDQFDEQEFLLQSSHEPHILSIFPNGLQDVMSAYTQ